MSSNTLSGIWRTNHMLKNVHLIHLILLNTCIWLLHARLQYLQCVSEWKYCSCTTMKNINLEFVNYIGIHRIMSQFAYTRNKSIRTINNAYYLWWSKQEPSINHQNVWYLNISKPSVIKFFVHLTSLFFTLVKFYCFASSFVPNIEAKSVVLELTTRYSGHWFWFLLLLFHSTMFL